jgi:hypothetical protein
LKNPSVLPKMYRPFAKPTNVWTEATRFSSPPTLIV